MKTRRNVLGVNCLVVAVGFILSVLMLNGAALAAGWLYDDTVPDVAITSPALGGTSYETSKAWINLAGTASDDSALSEIIWVNDRGGAGFASASGDWFNPWAWQANGITLQPGVNIITVTARDAVIPANEDSDYLVVTYNPSGPVPPSVVKAIDLTRTKVKLNIFKNTPGDDHISVLTYLKKLASEQFIMPMNKDVTVTLKVPDPNDSSVLIPIYTETIPADTAPYPSSKYRYTSGPPGIRDLTFQAASSTLIYMYVYIENVDFLRDIREFFGVDVAGYTTWLLGIKSLNFTVQTGSIAWTGDIPFTAPRLGSVQDNGNRVEYLYNR